MSRPWVVILAEHADDVDRMPADMAMRADAILVRRSDDGWTAIKAKHGRKVDAALSIENALSEAGIE